MITIVIPTHNRVDDLRRALQSVYTQTILPDEIIIIDDGSTPAVPETIFEGCPLEIRAKLLCNKISHGANNARNRGLREALGEIVVFLDDDDEFLSQKIERVKQVYDETKADVIYHPAIVKYDNEGISYKSFMANDITFRGMLKKALLGGASQIAFKRDSFLHLGAFDESLPALQDYEACLRCAKADLKFHLIPEPLTLIHCVTEAQSISKSLSNNQKALNAIFEKYRYEYETLTIVELRERDEWIAGMNALKMMLNKKNFSASASYFCCFWYSKKPSYLIVALFALFGIKTVVWLRSLKDKLSFKKT